MDEPTQAEQPSIQGREGPTAITPAPTAFPSVAQPQGNGLAVAGFVLGITSVVFCWWGIFALVQIILAITFSAIGRGHAKRGSAHGGLATAGLILGIMGAVLYFMIGIFSLGAGFFI